MLVFGLGSLILQHVDVQKRPLLFPTSVGHMNLRDLTEFRVFFFYHAYSFRWPAFKLKVSASVIFLKVNLSRCCKAYPEIMKL